jgi:hypothetical protein
MRILKRGANLMAFVVIGLLLVQQLPVSGSFMEQRGPCIDGICYCNKELCACDHCEHEPGHTGRWEEPSIIPCSSSSHMPMVVFSIDHAYPLGHAGLPNIPLLSVRFEPTVSHTTTLLVPDIFRPPRFSSSGVIYA